LKTHDGKAFVTTGEHSTITPCTLPEWLPVAIIEKMVVEFGSKLRKELVKLHRNSEVLLRHRAGSTDTQRISLDSIMGMPEREGVNQHNFGGDLQLLISKYSLSNV
jgi:hypothetical protein